MNAGSDCIPEDLLETHAWGRLSEIDSAPLEEHLLLCAACQDRLAQLDDYLRVARAAAEALAEDSSAPAARPVRNLPNIWNIPHPVLPADAGIVSH
jgi:anti-sigma factor RsiW